MSNIWRKISSILLCLGLAACSVPKPGVDSEADRQALYQAVRNHLTAGRCGDALVLIEPVYNSSYTNNEVRFLRASAQACKAGINFFALVANLSDSTNYSLVGSAFWTSMTKLFASTAGDGATEASWYALDALMSVWNGFWTIPASSKITRDSNNVGSDRAQDLTDEANSYRIFVAMATIGTTQNRYGAPNSAGQKTQNLPWITVGALDTTGCAYASSILTLLDSIESVSGSLTGSLKSALDNVTAIRSGLNTKCTADFGSYCSPALRDRDSCTGNTYNQNTAVSIVNFVNTPALGGWPQ